MPTPTLTTPRLLLRPFTPADAADVYVWGANPDVSRYTSWPAHRSMADAEAFIAMVLARGPHEQTWAICLKEQPTVIGAIEFSLTTPPAEADLHYVLSEPFWNRGLMTEAARAVLSWGLAAYPEVRRVVTCAVAENVGSTRVMEKCGMRFVRTFTSNWPKSPEPVIQHAYALER